MTTATGYWSCQADGHFYYLEYDSAAACTGQQNRELDAPKDQ